MKQLTQQIIEFYEKLSSWEHAVVKGSELSPGQIHAIEIIGHEESLRMKELAEKLGITTGTLTVMVDKLEQKGLLRRRPHESDRRSYLIELTAAGREHFVSHHEYHLQLTEEITSVLTPQETTALGEILAKLIKQM